MKIEYVVSALAFLYGQVQSKVPADRCFLLAIFGSSTTDEGESRFPVYMLGFSLIRGFMKIGEIRTPGHGIHSYCMFDSSTIYYTADPPDFSYYKVDLKSGDLSVMVGTASQEQGKIRHVICKRGFTDIVLVTENYILVADDSQGDVLEPLSDEDKGRFSDSIRVADIGKFDKIFIAKKHDLDEVRLDGEEVEMNSRDYGGLEGPLIANEIKGFFINYLPTPTPAVCTIYNNSRLQCFLDAINDDEFVVDEAKDDEVISMYGIAGYVFIFRFSDHSVSVVRRSIENENDTITMPNKLPVNNKMTPVFGSLITLVSPAIELDESMLQCTDWKRCSANIPFGYVELGQCNGGDGETCKFKCFEGRREASMNATLRCQEGEWSLNINTLCKEQDVVNKDDGGLTPVTMVVVGCLGLYAVFHFGAKTPLSKETRGSVRSLKPPRAKEKGNML